VINPSTIYAAACFRTWPSGSSARRRSTTISATLRPLPGFLAARPRQPRSNIAFAVALIAALKDHVPASLRAFLLALAVADDLLAIAVIALFYTAELVWMNLFLAGMGAVIWP
jgi:hypothetical protein